MVLNKTWDERTGGGMTFGVVNCTDTEALDRIHRLLDGVEWSPDTLDEIAEQVTFTGRLIRDPADLFLSRRDDLDDQIEQDQQAGVR